MIQSDQQVIDSVSKLAGCEMPPHKYHDIWSSVESKINQTEHMTKADQRNRRSHHIVPIAVAVAAVAVVVGGLQYARHQPPFTTHPQSASIFKAPTSIGSVYIFAGGGAALKYQPTDETFVNAEVLKWLKSSTPTSVDIPKQISTVQSRGNIGPVKLQLSINNKQTVSVQPAFYLDLAQSGANIHYFPNILEYQNGKTITYIESSQMYTWLMDGSWVNQFTVAPMQ